MLKLKLIIISIGYVHVFLNMTSSVYKMTLLYDAWGLITSVPDVSTFILGENICDMLKSL